MESEVYKVRSSQKIPTATPSEIEEDLSRK
jgi:hypothetical protein